jgi:hypothetical protein
MIRLAMVPPKKKGVYACIVSHSLKDFEPFFPQTQADFTSLPIQSRIFWEDPAPGRHQPDTVKSPSSPSFGPDICPDFSPTEIKSPPPGRPVNWATAYEFG